MAAWTSYTLLGVGPGWPRSLDLRFPDGTHLEGTDDGRIAVRVGADTVPRRITQPIEVTSPGWIPICVTSEDGRIEIYIHDLVDRLDDSASIRVVRLHPPPVRPRSYEEPAARARCSAAMKHRAAKYRTQGAPEKGKRPRTLSEDLVRLAESNELLRDAVCNARSGRSAYLSIIKTQLRALILERPGKNWNPLLFRIAGRLDLPLPVYDVPRKAPPPGMPVLDIEVGARTQAWFPTDEIVDLQACLDERLAEVEGKAITGNHLVFRVGSADGAHIDDAIDTWFERLEEIESRGQSVLAETLITLGETVADLAAWVGAEATRPAP